MIRMAIPADGERLAAIYAPAVTDRATSFELTAPDASEMARRVSTLTARTPWLVLEENGRVLGYAYASPHRTRACYRWSADVSVYVAADARGNGIGHALYTALLSILELQRFHAAFAGITLPNDASVALHEAVGFEALGVYREVGFKHGHWHDVGWWRRSLGSGGKPAEPAPFLANLDRFIATRLLLS